MNILTIGSATQDIFLVFDAQTTELTVNQESCCFLILPEGKKIELQNILYHSGGGATNTAASFKKLGFNIESFFKIGDDEQGNFILEELARLGIQCTHSIVDSQHKTAVSCIVPCPSGDRTILAYRGANKSLTQQELPIAALSDFDCLYVTSLSGQAARLLPYLTHEAKKAGTFVAINPGTSQLSAHADYLYQALPAVDILMLNRYESHLLLASILSKPIEEISKNEATMSQFFSIVGNAGPATVVVTDGAHGVYVLHEGNIVFHPSIKTTVNSSVGAGDAFGSTFVACLLQKKDIKQAIGFGILNAANVIQHVGAKTGLLTMQELEARYKTMAG